MKRISKRLLAPVLVLAVMSLSMTALAQETTSTTVDTTSTTTPALAPPPDTTVVLPLLGSPLTIEITFDADGALHEVAIDPAAGLAVVASDDDPDSDDSGEIRIEFTDGAVEIKIDSEDGKLETKVEATNLESLLGPGRWSADVFGNGVAFVSYTVVDGAFGPTISIDGVAVPDGVDFQIDALEFEVDDDGESKASVRVRFFLDGVERTFKIKVEFENEDDGSTEVMLKLSLSDFEEDDSDDDNSGHGNSDDDSDDDNSGHGNSDDDSDDDDDDHDDDDNSGHGNSDDDDDN